MGFSCEECYKEFASKYNLSRHMKTVHNTENTQFHCCVSGCMRSYKRKEELTRHLLLNHPELATSVPPASTYLHHRNDCSSPPKTSSPQVSLKCLADHTHGNQTDQAPCTSERVQGQRKRQSAETMTQNDKKKTCYDRMDHEIAQYPERLHPVLRAHWKEIGPYTKKSARKDVYNVPVVGENLDEVDKKLDEIYHTTKCVYKVSFQNI